MGQRLCLSPLIQLDFYPLPLDVCVCVGGEWVLEVVIPVFGPKFSQGSVAWLSPLLLKEYNLGHAKSFVFQTSRVSLNLF